MASELKRPPTRKGSGSRPPTSRFQEGSMNDRTSAAPPAQFMGPDQLRDYETQFYAEPPVIHEARRRRPLSASGQLQATSTSRQMTGQETEQERTVTHKKSTGFFGRVRDALFNRGVVGGGPAAGGQGVKQQDVRRKHSSLQEPLHHPQHPRYPPPPPPPPPRPDYLVAGRSQSEVNIPQMFTNAKGMADRPSREDVMASYNQLMASGFFQSHAIQSTRHAAPTAMAARGRQPPRASTDPQDVSRPPISLPSIYTTSRPSSVSPMPPRTRLSASPSPLGRDSREFVTIAEAASTSAPQRPSLSALFTGSIPDLKTKDSRYTLRGRKRARGDESPVVATPEPQSSSSTTSYFSQPLKRVAKKLREMPSSTFQAAAAAATTTTTTIARDEAGHNSNASKKNIMPTSVHHHHHQTAPSTTTNATGSATATTSRNGSPYPLERPVHLRSPSPATLEMDVATTTMESVTVITGRSNDRGVERPVVHDRTSFASRARRPRRTFSYTLTESVRSRSRAIDREYQRELQGDMLPPPQQIRGSSGTRSGSGGRIRVVTTQEQQQNGSSSRSSSRNPLGIWQRVSLEDTIIHRDSSDSMRSQAWEREGTRESEERGLTISPNDNRAARRTTPSPSPLRTMAGANRGGVVVPSALKSPERWHGSGKAYHLKDRGSRLDMARAAMLRRSEDSGTAEGKNYYTYTYSATSSAASSHSRRDSGKENDEWRRSGGGAAVDADGDVDMLYHHQSSGRSREEHYRQHQPRWRIGNAL